MTLDHHHRVPADVLGDRARRAYAGWLAEGLTHGDIRRLLVDLVCMANIARDAVPPEMRSDIGSSAAALLDS